MAKIEGFRVKNFKVLKDVTLGRLWKPQKKKPLTAMTAVIGKNGVGKSALFDAFGFLADALKSGVEEACDQRGRGGFEKLRSQGATGPIEFEVYYTGNAAKPNSSVTRLTLGRTIQDVHTSGENASDRDQKAVGHFIFCTSNMARVWHGRGHTREVKLTKKANSLISKVSEDCQH